MDFERLLLEHREYIRRLVRRECARLGLSADDAEDYESEVQLKLLQDDYAVLRQFQGRSSLKTFLSTVVVHEVQNVRVRIYGRWRLSAAARRLGELACRLEVLVYRDKLPLREAFQRIQAERHPPPTQEELRDTFKQISRRAEGRPVHAPDVDPDDLQSTDSADDGVVAAEEESQRLTREATVRRSIARLDELPRVVLGMVVVRGLSVADVARAMQLDQKRLYRQIEQWKARLKGYLEDEGLSLEDL